MSQRMIARARPGWKQAEIPAPAAYIRIAHTAAFAMAGWSASTITSHRHCGREHYDTR